MTNRPSEIKISANDMVADANMTVEITKSKQFLLNGELAGYVNQDGIIELNDLGKSKVTIQYAYEPEKVKRAPLSLHAGVTKKVKDKAKDKAKKLAAKKSKRRNK